MYSNAFRRITLLLLIATGALAILPGATPAQAQSDRPVMAFYYPWYEPSDWRSGKASDLPSPTYSGGADATLLRHIQQADDAGIDSLTCAWFGPNEERLNKRCRRLMDLIEQSGRDLKVAIMPEQAAWDSLNSVSALTEAINVLKRDFMNRPSYFHFQGKPALFFFNPSSLGGASTWQTLRDRVDPNREQFWFGGTDNFNYLDVYDALYYFDITWERSTGAAMASYSNRLKQYNDSHGTQKPFIATAEPGYNDLRVRNGHSRSREDGAYYRGTWQTAIDRNATAVVLTSFNEFFEGTYIEPSELYGDLYLQLTRELIDKFHAEVGKVTTTANNQTCRQFSETGKQACGRILQYWEQNGGLEVFGYPISDQYAQTIEGKEYQVQIFERNRLELHPENAAPYDVLLGRLGADLLSGNGRDWTSYPKADASAAYYFSDTGQAIAPEFIDYWSSHGLEFEGSSSKTFQESLALFGMPLSPASMETNSSGDTVLTQWFERARFEYHPDQAAEYRVLLGLLGREASGIQ